MGRRRGGSPTCNSLRQSAGRKTEHTKNDKWEDEEAVAHLQQPAAKRKKTEHTKKDKWEDEEAVAPIATACGKAKEENQTYRNDNLIVCKEYTNWNWTLWPLNQVNWCLHELQNILEQRSPPLRISHTTSNIQDVFRLLSRLVRVMEM